MNTSFPSNNNNNKGLEEMFDIAYLGIVSSHWILHTRNPRETNFAQTAGEGPSYY